MIRIIGTHTWICLTLPWRWRTQTPGSSIPNFRSYSTKSLCFFLRSLSRRTKCNCNDGAPLCRYETTADRGFRGRLKVPFYYCYCFYGFRIFLFYIGFLVFFEEIYSCALILFLTLFTTFSIFDYFSSYQSYFYRI